MLEVIGEEGEVNRRRREEKTQQQEEKDEADLQRGLRLGVFNGNF